MIAECICALPGTPFATEMNKPIPSETSTSAASGVPPSFEALLDAYQEKVFRLAWSMLGSEAAAQDATQEVFLKIWKALPKYRGGGSASSWIYTITRNTCLTELKKNQRRHHVSLAEEPVEAELDRLTASQPSEHAAGRAMDAQVLLAELPEHYRRVVTLFYLEQKSYEEVASMLAIPMGTVKTYLHRAKKELMRTCALREEPHD